MRPDNLTPLLQRKNIDFYIENFIAFIDFHFAVSVKRKECKYKKAAGRVGPEPSVRQQAAGLVSNRPHNKALGVKL